MAKIQFHNFASTVRPEPVEGYEQKRYSYPSTGSGRTEFEVSFG